MPAESLALHLRPFCPLGRYRHGCDPPDQLTRFSFLPCTFACEHFPLDRPSSFFTLSLLSQQLNVLESFLNPFRPTIGQLKSLEPVSKKFAKKRGTDDSHVGGTCGKTNANGSNRHILRKYKSEDSLVSIIANIRLTEEVPSCESIQLLSSPCSWC